MQCVSSRRGPILGLPLFATMSLYCFPVCWGATRRKMTSPITSTASKSSLRLLSMTPPRSTPLERIGLQHVTKDLILSCAAVFAAYHAVKRSHFTTGLSGSPLACEQGITAQRFFAEAFQASADDAGLICKSAARVVPLLHQL